MCAGTKIQIFLLVSHTWAGSQVARGWELSGKNEHGGLATVKDITLTVYYILVGNELATSAVTTIQSGFTIK